MNYLTADDGLISRLRGIMEPVEIRDANGNVLGHFTPVVPPEVQALYDKADALFDLEEAKRDAAAKQPGFSLQEVMRFIRSLEKEG